MLVEVLLRTPCLPTLVQCTMRVGAALLLRTPCLPMLVQCTMLMGAALLLRTPCLPMSVQCTMLVGTALLLRAPCLPMLVQCMRHPHTSAAPMRLVWLQQATPLSHAAITPSNAVRSSQAQPVALTARRTAAVDAVAPNGLAAAGARSALGRSQTLPRGKVAFRALPLFLKMMRISFNVQ